ncbi:polysaccharide pyruvyl transferase family protein [Leptolyngbya sp. FACHB-321]|uniref:polysaccharide pyruvyl transferase family protein n=1 Tax=Leptolyngbya sp. FACHB-321 TaxID=2692807 RepID=UPI0016866595|nr:polysaccharide pyruvyl transferase family protein [Leptolyngbya sp. FACHB-321]MBD2038533.1 polysaccharide pyruvyl transferase family protein [Leptolyngbya sp. FACHB-321]
MIVEIRGIHFENKGSELMLYAVVQKLSEWNNDNTVAMRFKAETFRKRAEAGLYQLLYSDRKSHFSNQVTESIVNFLPKSLISSLGITTYSKINAVLDASGFAYSDQWGAKKSAVMADLAKRMSKQGKKVILLPQAFGPFDEPEVKSNFLQVLENSHLIFARDPISYKCLVDLGGSSSHIKMAPDFTNLVKGRVPDYFERDKKRACIIPNVRMIDKNSANVADSYLQFLEICTELLVEAELNPFILVHDFADEELALQLQEKFGGSLEVIIEQNPLNLKGILGNCYVVVSSRFHGLISALSQGVPCLATGWSHKYRMLFEDYASPECLVYSLDSREEIESKLKLIIEEPSRSGLIARLQTTGMEQKALASEMWTEVYKVLVA